MLLRIGHKRGDRMSLWCKFLEISGVFYKLIVTCRGIRDRSSAGSRAARSSAGYQTPESNTRIFTKRGCKGASRWSNDDCSHDISRPGMPIAMHHWEEIGFQRCLLLLGLAPLPFLRCVFLTTPAVKGASARP